MTLDTPATKPFTVLFIGAGDINFGCPEGPWNHSKRLEALLGSRLSVLGIVDPNRARAQARIDEKLLDADAAQVVAQAWRTATIYATIQDAHSDLQQRGCTEISLVVNGCPPQFRGLPTASNDAQAMSLLGPMARSMLVEKPISSADPLVLADQLQQTAQMYQSWQQQKQLQIQQQANGAQPQTAGILSVGYMLRYLAPVAQIFATLREHGLTPMCVSARYFMAYEFAVNPQWWDKSVWGGPVVEQGTHFVDLVRYLAGAAGGNDVLEDTVQATTVNWDDPAGVLRKKGFDEEAVVPDPDRRIPRTTAAIWKHAKGTIGSLTHGVALHGDHYDTEIEVLADGWRFKLRDAYSTEPTLTIRSPESTKDVVHRFPNEDPFRSEFKTIIDALDGTSSAVPLSSWSDALQTYRLTWKIRKQAEAQREAHKAAASNGQA